MMRPMASKKDVLTQLSRSELLAFVGETGVEVADRRVREQLISALGSSKRARLPAFLLALSADRLKEIAGNLGIEGGGRNKALIIENITGGAAKAKTVAPAAPATKAKRSSRVVGATPAAAPLRASKGRGK